MELITALIRALVLTLATELAVSLPLARTHAAPMGRLLVTVTLMNIITNPTLNLALMITTSLASGFGNATAVYYAALAAGELTVFCAEALILHTTLRLSAARAALVSLILNLSSFTVGILVASLPA